MQRGSSNKQTGKTIIHIFTFKSRRLGSVGTRCIRSVRRRGHFFDLVGQPRGLAVPRLAPKRLLQLGQISLEDMNAVISVKMVRNTNGASMK